MKIIKNIIEYLIAIAVIPAIVLTVISVTELKDVKTVQYELLSEEDGIFNVTPGTYDRLVKNKKIKNYELESNYPLITQEEMERATWEHGDLKNEIYIDENGQKRIIVNVGKNIFDGSDDEDWLFISPDVNHSGYYGMWIEMPNAISTSLINSYNAPFVYSWNEFRDAVEIVIYPTTIEKLYVKLPATNETEFREYLSQNPLTITYELADKQDRPVEVYDFSKFRLTYDKNRIRVVFDLDNEYYLWEITKDDKMIPINGQYDLGNIWTVKFYVYEIQQPLIRSLVLLIPLIVISGLLLYMYNLIKKKGLMY